MIATRMVFVSLALMAATAPGPIWAEPAAKSGVHQKNDTRSVTVVGHAAIRDNDQTTARRGAIADALRAAVEQGIGVYVDAKSLVENAELINDRILSHASGYAVLRSVNWERVTPDRAEFQVEVTADVSSAPLVEALKQLGLTRRWRVMVVIPEQHLGRTIPDPAAETEMIKLLLRKGFYLVDQKQSAEVRNSSVMRQIEQGDFKAAAEVGRRYGADILLTGEAFSQETFRRPVDVGGIPLVVVGCRARVECRAIRVDTAEIVSADGAQESGQDSTTELASKKSLAAAAAKLAESMAPDILELPAAGTYQVQIEISGFTKISNASTFEEALRRMSGVRQVTRQNYTGGVDLLEVQVESELYERLSADLETHAGFARFKIGVQSDNKNQIVARAASG